MTCYRLDDWSFIISKSVTVALYNDWLQNAQAVFNYTTHTRVYD